MNPSTSCPRTGEIVALAEGRLAPEAAGLLVDHAAGCPSCFRGLAVARAVAGTPGIGESFDLEAAELQAPRPGQGAMTASRVRRFPAWVPYAAAASVALLVVAGGLEIFGGLHDVPAGGGPVRGGVSWITLLTPAPGAALDAPPQRLRWRAEKEGARFRVRILASVTEEIWRVETKESTVDLPADKRARLAAGGRFLFEVGLFRGSAEVAEPEIAPFEVRPGR